MLTIWSPFCRSGPFWIISDKNEFFPQMDKVGFGGGASEQTNQLLFEMVQKVAERPKRVPNGQKHLDWPFLSLLDYFGMLTSLPCLAIFSSKWIYEKKVKNW